MYKYLLIIFLTIIACSAIAQQLPINEQEARAELQKRGISEEDVREKMKAKGFDVDNIDPNRIPQFQKALEETIKELEAAKDPIKATTNDSAGVEKVLEEASNEIVKETIQDQADQISQEVQESVEDGTPLNEAISEELLEAQPDLPNSDLYGQHIFRNKSIKVFDQSDEIKAPDTYVLGPGDEIVISIWGASVLEETHNISSEGYIKPANLPRIFLKGLTFGQAKELIYRRYSLAYSFNNGNFEVGLKYARTTSINLTGEIMNPGTYALPAINTAFNALMAGDGPNNIGSVRNIKLIRAGAEQQRIDIYEYLFDPSVSAKFYLQEGDFIFVPVAEKIISIKGAIKRPFKYELLQNENLVQLIEYAGGLTENAYKGNIQIQRFVNDEEVIIDVDLNQILSNRGDYLLKNGDRVSINEIPTPVENIVNIGGAVILPGEYALSDGMRIYDLLERGVLSKDARRDIAYITRVSDDGQVTYQQLDLDQILKNQSSEDNMVLKAKDRLLILNRRIQTDVRKVAIQGAVRSPGEYNYTQQSRMRISDLINISGGLQSNATPFAFIYRKNESAGDVIEYQRVDLSMAISDETSTENILLLPNDLVRVLNKEYFQDSYDVQISGAVRNPGNFKYDPTLNLFDILTLAGGLKPDAAKFAYIYRTDPTGIRNKEYIKIDVTGFNIDNNTIDNIALFPNDIISVFSNAYFSDKVNVSIGGMVRNPGEYEYDPSLGISDIITLAGGILPQGASNRIDISRLIIESNQPTSTVIATIEVDTNYQIINGKSIELQPFDQIFVRAVPGFELQKNVVVEGEVMYPGTYALVMDNERISSLIERSGGLTLEAFPPGATLIRKEGNIGHIVIQLDEALRNANSRANMTLKAGDRIVIPKTKDIVSISGAVNAKEVYSETIINEGKINIAYQGRKSAKWYINQYAGGFDENAEKTETFVEHPNGEVQKAKDFLFFKSYPKVKPGSIVSVQTKPVKEEKQDGSLQNNEPIDWGKVVSESLAQVTAVLTLIVLLQRIN